jgi:hypothetical protein
VICAIFYLAILAPLADSLLSDMQALLGEDADGGVGGHTTAHQIKRGEHFGGSFSAHDYACTVVHCWLNKYWTDFIVESFDNA